MNLGGILPVEDSDDFIDGMSTLAGDSVSTRFTSMVRENGTNPNQADLIWQTGQVKFIGSESSQPNYRFFVVNPVSKTYESMASSTIKPYFYCQYLGDNLALNKATYPSSSRPDFDQGPSVVDGIIDMNFWHEYELAAMSKNWFAVDLGEELLISWVIFVARRDCCEYRNRFIQAWIGTEVPPVLQALDYTKYRLCGEYPYIQGLGFVSGILCDPGIRGRILVLENGQKAMQLTEVLIF